MSLNDRFFIVLAAFSPTPPLHAGRLARAQAQQGGSETQLAAPLRLPLGQLVPAWRSAGAPGQSISLQDVAALAAQLGCEPAALADLVQRITGDEPSHG